MLYNVNNMCTEQSEIPVRNSKVVAINPCRSSYHMNELLDYIPDITKQMFWPWVLLWSCGFEDTVAQLAHASNQRDASMNHFYAEWIEINWWAWCLALCNIFRPLAYCKVVPYSSLYTGCLSLFLCCMYWQWPLRLEPSLFSISVRSYMPFPLSLVRLSVSTCISNERNGTPRVCKSGGRSCSQGEVRDLEWTQADGSSAETGEWTQQGLGMDMGDV